MRAEVSLPVIRREIETGGLKEREEMRTWTGDDAGRRMEVKRQ